MFNAPSHSMVSCSLQNLKRIHHSKHASGGLGATFHQAVSCDRACPSAWKVLWESVARSTGAMVLTGKLLGHAGI